MLPGWRRSNVVIEHQNSQRRDAAAMRLACRRPGNLVLAAAACLLVLSSMPAEAHNDHMLIGVTAAGRLRHYSGPAGSVADGVLMVLNLIPPGGPIAGFSAAVPGFSMIPTAVPEEDVYPPAPGADLWVELIRVDAPMLIIETPSYYIINDRHPPELRVGGGVLSHVHPLWLLDTFDPQYDSSRCIWEVTFILKDKGVTGYAASAPLTFRFAAGAIPCPADFDCDGDVDTNDLTIFQGCATGPDLPYDGSALPAGCMSEADHQGFIRPDLDRDGDVDMTDFGTFQRCFSGTDEPAEPDCAT